MVLSLVKPKKALNKAFLKQRPLRSEMELFKTNLVTLLGKVDEIEREENQKNHVRDFLLNTWYKEKNEINTKGDIDLAIHLGKEAKDNIGVIIETKRPGNKNEMIFPDRPNAKALQELVLYYIRERLDQNNIDLKYCIITNIWEWYIFESSFFEKYFFRNKSFVRQYEEWRDGKKVTKDTGLFYDEIARPYIDAIEDEIPCVRFDIRDYEIPLRNVEKADDSRLIVLFKLLSPQHLLKLPFANDSNTLDKSFYSELLHIIGLSETKSGSKKIIERKKEVQRDHGSLIENTIVQLDTRDKISRLPKPAIYGESQAERLFNVSLELVITWLNRILFLKLLEAQLIRYHKGDPVYGFLNCDRVDGFDDLDNLFFRVLARKPDERDPEMAGQFSRIPYLNSSLFEPTELEQITIFISNLQDHALIPILSSTVLKDGNGKRRTGKLPGLQYLFEFLDAYDFAGEGSEDIQEDNKTLINASVLGLIFEKINGYKDGSFFTPGFITMYMCRETIRRAVLQKFNEAKGWQCETLDQLYDKIEDRQEANRIMNSLRICDPAVGSGHFLVSALNEIIAIKSDLKILTDRNGKRLKEYRVEVANDELVVTDEEGDLFEYIPGNNESQRIQEALFHEKQTIIENCLFGVDINPNSVKICRLRLWIELLKNAYYLTPRPPLRAGEGELETLPNIDINIKCGNSLISRYSLDADIRQALKKSKWSIDSYRIAVMTYRNATTKEEKRSMEKLIESIKSDFETEVAANDKRLIQLRKLNGDLFNLTQQTTLFDQSKKEKDAWNKKVKELTAKIQKLETELEEIKSNKIYENAFEWRFEFPEVLNDEGDFVGFDVVIGNPPYIPLEAFNDTEKDFFKNKFPQFERKYETSVMFMIEGFDLGNKFGLLSFIAPLTWQTGENYSVFRHFLLSNKGIDQIINLPFNTFEDAYVDTGIYLFSNTLSKTYAIYNFHKKDVIADLSDIPFENVNISELVKPDFKLILNKEVGKLFSKFSENNFVSLGMITKSTQGLSRSRFPQVDPVLENPDIFPFLSKGNVYNYSLIKQEIYSTSLSEMKSLQQFYHAEEKILIRRIINRQDRLSVAYCNEKLVFKKDINPFIIIDHRFHIHYLLGVLCSRLISYLYLKSSSIATKDDFRQTTLAELRKLPIPNVSESSQNPIIELVKHILQVRDSDPNANTFLQESRIDSLVYELYGLTEEEIRIVEGE